VHIRSLRRSLLSVQRQLQHVRREPEHPVQNSDQNQQPCNQVPGNLELQERVVEGQEQERDERNAVLFHFRGITTRVRVPKGATVFAAFVKVSNHLGLPFHVLDFYRFNQRFVNFSITCEEAEITNNEEQVYKIIDIRIDEQAHNAIHLFTNTDCVE
jgi:hypothetical protein